MVNVLKPPLFDGISILAFKFSDSLVKGKLGKQCHLMLKCIKIGDYCNNYMMLQICFTLIFHTIL